MCGGNVDCAVMNGSRKFLIEIMAVVIVKIAKTAKNKDLDVTVKFKTN